ncbi:hypothetical protein QOZ94_003827 [Xanthobacter agilis]|uniref:Uncharacterized protein n=1 Tax=Xanthobacter agilis TaxID=47492 RepID=A0ABU0LIP5_XANAG|nr:hypothetical protein [Xanthobacter agilis]MDQ0507011.1 hypothetical protein [Xanthobacter agilis]
MVLPLPVVLRWVVTTCCCVVLRLPADSALARKAWIATATSSG